MATARDRSRAEFASRLNDPPACGKFQIVDSGGRLIRTSVATVGRAFMVNVARALDGARMSARSTAVSGGRTKSSAAMKREVLPTSFPARRGHEGRAETVRPAVFARA